jgi:error-prone DNA polymerase
VSFAHLIVHSHHSFLRGASPPEALCAEAAARGFEALALTDVNGLYGIVPFLKAARAAGVRPIVGVDLREPRPAPPNGWPGGIEPADSRRGFVEAVGAGTAGSAPGGSDRVRPAGPGTLRAPRRAVLLVEEQEGYPVVCEIITSRHLRQDFNLERALLERGPGVAVLTGDPALLETLVRARGPAGHYLALTAWGGWRRGLGEASGRGLLREGVVPVASGEVWFARPEEHARHRLLTAIGCNAPLSGLSGAWIAPRTAHLRGARELAAVFGDRPEAVRAAAELAERCGGGPPLGGLHLPVFPFPDCPGAHTDLALSHLRRQCLRGVVWRYGTRARPRSTEGQIWPADDLWCPAPGRPAGGAGPDPAGLREDVVGQLEHELGIIAAMGYADYFLVVADIVRYAREARIPTCGRGSAANSVVAYTLGLTHVEPLANRLYFERFLNQGRSDAPDVDLDFSWKDRERVIDYVYRTHGRDRTAMIATQVTFQGRAAVREVAKVYGLPEGEIAAVTRRMGYAARAGDLRETVAANPRFRGVDLAQEPWRTVLEQAEELDGFPRHLGVHPGGIVIAPGPITRHLPLERSAGGLVVTQWDMYPVEDAGLVKIDLLGNRSLAVIDDACTRIEQQHGRRVSYVHFDPTRDEATRELIARGDTVGCFYIESPATRGLIRKLHCRDFATLVAASSIIRPGVSRSGMMHAYIERHHGAPFTWLHPKLAELLGETYGVMCYQEDVIKVAHHIAGLSLADADGLRKSMSKKRNHERLERYRRQFTQGALERGVDPGVTAELWRQIASFSGYSFCKAHSASYALVSFQAAWLRAHYPAEFMAAVLSNHGGFYSPLAYVSEAMRMGLELRLPDVNESLFAWTGQTCPEPGPGEARGWLRVGLEQVGGLAAAGARALVAERERGGPFRDFADLAARLLLKPAEREALIRCGALDGLGEGSRPELMWQALIWEKTRRPPGGGSAPRPAPGPERRLAPAARALLLPLDDPESALPPVAPDYDRGTLLAFEASTLGFLVSAHPLELYRPAIEQAAAETGPPLIAGRDLAAHLGRRVRTVGWMVTAKPVYTVHEEVMQFISFEDTTALYETTFFPAVYRRYAPRLLTRGPFLLTGVVDEEWGAVSLTVEGVHTLGRGDLPHHPS